MTNITLHREDAGKTIQALTTESASMLVSVSLSKSKPFGTDLISITKRESLRPNVLIGILHALLQRRPMLFMFPMLVPQILRIDRGEE